MRETKLLIEKEEYNKLMQLALFLDESSFLIKAKKEKDSLWRYDGLVKGEYGKEFSTQRLGLTCDFSKKGLEENSEDYVFIDGHSHPRPAGTIIQPMDVGFSIPRTEELKAMRNSYLSKTKEGKEYLAKREEMIKQYLSEVDKNNKNVLLDKLKSEFKNISMELGISNLVDINGILGYITNGLDNRLNKENIEKDLAPKNGDLSTNALYRQNNVGGLTLIHPKKEYIGQNSSIDKFVISALQITKDKWYDIKKVDVVVI